MARAKLKAEDRYNDLIKQINSGIPLDTWTFRDIVAECQQLDSMMSRVVLALAHIAKGDVSGGFAQIENLLPHGDTALAKLYCNLLERFSLIEQLDKCIYSLADKYPSKWLSYKAGGIAYLTGRLSYCAKYLECHYKMLSADEEREVAEKFRLEAIDDMAQAYEFSGCTADQYKEIGYAVGRVLAAFSLPRFQAEITGAHGGSYIIEILGAEPEIVSQMNMRLADEICAIDLLDDCRLIARFSVGRKGVEGVTYAYD